MSLDPRYACRCEWDENIDKIYRHGLGPTCGDPRYVDDVFGNFGFEQEPNDEQARLFASDDIIFELSQTHLNIEIESLDVLGFRSQEIEGSHIDGTNHVVKYQALVDGEEMLILALIHEPLPLTGHLPFVISAQTDGVTADSVIPDNVQPSIIIEPTLGSEGDFCFFD